MSLELEEERSSLPAKVHFAIRREDQFLKDLSIQESRIGLTGPHTIAGMLGIAVLLSSFLNFS